MLQEYRTKESARILYPASFRAELSEIHELYGLEHLREMENFVTPKGIRLNVEVLFSTGVR